jgi:hypothetical protein
MQDRAIVRIDLKLDIYTHNNNAFRPREEILSNFERGNFSTNMTFVIKFNMYASRCRTYPINRIWT